MELEGKIALITGASRRIGRSIALAMANEGADVIVHYNSGAEAAEKVVEDIRAIGADAEAVQADLTSADSIARMFELVRESHQRLDVLVNNAAVYHRTPIDTLTAEQWDAEFAVNARAPALCIRHATELMDRGGAIVNITDIGAEKGWANYPAYCASKAALLGLTKSCAKALAGRNIRVNAVAPGAIIWQDTDTEEIRPRVIRQIPMQRTGQPEDIAHAVVFLAGHEYITAQTLRVDGGWCMS